MSDTRDPFILALAQQAITAAQVKQQNGRISGGVTAVAKALGYSRPSLSRYLNEANHPAPGKIEAALFAKYTRRNCPYLGSEVALGYCVETNTGPTPTWDPSALAQRRMCQICENKPEEDKS